MSKLIRRRDKEERWTTNTPLTVHKRINENQILGRGLEVIYAGNWEFEIFDVSITIAINFNRRTCSCGEFHISDIPWKHGCKVIVNKRLRIDNYVDPSLIRDAYLRTYSSIILPVPSEENWIELNNVLEIKPSVVVRKVGRPPTKRHREHGEV